LAQGPSRLKLVVPSPGPASVHKKMKVVGLPLTFLAVFGACAAATRLEDAADKRKVMAPYVASLIARGSRGGGTKSEKQQAVAAAAAAVVDVVTELKKMQQATKDDWDKSKSAFKKFDSGAEKSIHEMTTDIADTSNVMTLASNRMDELKGLIGTLSMETGKLTMDIADNMKANEDAKALRAKELKAFKAADKDLAVGIDQMISATKQLSDVNADQTRTDNKDGHKQFMAGYKENKLLSIKSSMRKAMVAADSIVQPAHKAQMIALIEGPAFASTYTAQSGQVTGILKEMQTTFESNKKTGETNEQNALTQFVALDKTQTDSDKTMTASLKEKEGQIRDNDEELSEKIELLAAKKKHREETEETLTALRKQLGEQTTLFQSRRKYATNEDVAIGKAIFILKHEFTMADTLNKGSNAKASSFMQLAAASGSAATPHSEAAKFLQASAAGKNSARIGSVIKLLKANSPFDIILSHLETQIAVVKKEGEMGVAQDKWCETMLAEQEETITQKGIDVDNAKTKIDKIDVEVGHPETGLKAALHLAEQGLVQIRLDQIKQAVDRKAENRKYQSKILQLQREFKIMGKGENVLKDYYATLKDQQFGDAPKGKGDVFSGNYEGQEKSGGAVLKLLAKLKKEKTVQEDKEHGAELKLQHEFEDVMKKMKGEEKGFGESIVDAKKTMASRKIALVQSIKVKKSTESEKLAIERLNTRLKPGCALIKQNIPERAKELKALQKSEVMLKETPAFKKAVDDAKIASYGKCTSLCVPGGTIDDAGAECQACMQGISVPGYCAGHKGAKGCKK